MLNWEARGTETEETLNGRPRPFNPRSFWFMIAALVVINFLLLGRP
jgi:hypothetical protein